MSNPNFDQVVEGNVDIKKLSKNKYKIKFNKISKFLKYQTWSDSSKTLNDDRAVYYEDAKKWMKNFNILNSSLKAVDQPLFTPTTVMEIGNHKYLFVIYEAKLNSKGHVVFNVSTKEIDFLENKILKLPCGRHDGVRFDIDSYPTPPPPITLILETVNENTPGSIVVSYFNFDTSIEFPGNFSNLYNDDTFMLINTIQINSNRYSVSYQNNPQNLSGSYYFTVNDAPALYSYLQQIIPSTTNQVATFYALASVPFLSNFNISTQYYAGSQIIVQITPPNSTSGGAFTYSSSNLNIATVLGSTVYFLTVGTVIITATQATSGIVSQGSISTTVTVQLQAGVTSFVGANFIGADLSNLDLSKMNFTDANFTGANLASSSPYYTNLNNANLTGANFTDANLYQVVMNYSTLTRANLNRANLLGIASYWDSSDPPAPFNLETAVAKGNGINFTNGWSFMGAPGNWTLINSNIPY
jgi:hypothetical protein